MLPLYAARIEDLVSDDFVKARLRRVPPRLALLTPEALIRAGLSPAAKVLDLKGRRERERKPGAHVFRWTAAGRDVALSLRESEA
jgi:hypothetical protein